MGVVDVDVVVVGRGRVVVVVVGLGRVVVVDGATAGGVPGGGATVLSAGWVVVVVVAPRPERFAARVYQNASVGSAVVVEVGTTLVVEVVDEAEVDRGVLRVTWMPRTSVAPTARPSRHFETPTTPSTISSTIRRPLRMRSSGL